MIRRTDLCSVCVADVSCIFTVSDGGLRGSVYPPMPYRATLLVLVLCLPLLLVDFECSTSRHNFAWAAANMAQQWATKS